MFEIRTARGRIKQVGRKQMLDFLMHQVVTSPPIPTQKDVWMDLVKEIINGRKSLTYKDQLDAFLKAWEARPASDPLKKPMLEAIEAERKEIL